jgi:putative nucleotidyltransferase with HDIG domain
MAADAAILLVSDHLDRSTQLARALGSLSLCHMIGVHQQVSTAGPVVAVVTDVNLRDPVNIECLCQLLSRFRKTATPIVAILQNNSHQERVQAAAVGATSAFAANAPLSDIFAALVKATGLASAPVATASLTPEQNVEQAQIMFRNLFVASARGGNVSRACVESATTFALAAVTEGGIRQWLQVVLNYHEPTYRHCMLVTGFAAEFASILGFSENDQKHLTRGALLHDLGKAQIPCSILNKAGALSSAEIDIMRTHSTIGYELLKQQNDYEPDLLEVVLRHHELLDGSGYPDGLAGSQITDLVRLVTVCDIYAALIEHRAYREPMTPMQAFQVLQEMDGKVETTLVREFSRVAKNVDDAPFRLN